MNSEIVKISVCRDFQHTAGQVYNRKYLNKIFLLGKLEKYSVCANFAHTTKVGKTYSTKYKNLRGSIRKFRIVQILGYLPVIRLKCE